MRKDRLRVGSITEPIKGQLGYWLNFLTNSQELEQVAADALVPIKQLTWVSLRPRKENLT